MASQEYTQLVRIVEELQRRVKALESGENNNAIDAVSIVTIPKVVEAVTTGSETTNGLLREITVTIGDGSDTIEVLDYPDNILLYKYRGKIYAIPSYDASTLIYK